MKCQSILIVEDDNDIRDTVEDVLRTEGYRVHAVSNGHEALQALTKMEGQSLILLDMKMPLFDGWEFLEARRKNVQFASLPVVVMSAMPVESATASIRKPIDLDTLMRVVGVYCEEPGAIRPLEQGLDQSFRVAV